VQKIVVTFLQKYKIFPRTPSTNLSKIVQKTFTFHVEILVSIKKTHYLFIILYCLSFLKTIMLDCQKHLFSLPDDVHYLNCAYMSPLLKSVEIAAIEGVQKKRLPYTITNTDFFDTPQKTRELFAQLVNAPSYHSISLLPSVSYGMGIVAKNLEGKSGQNIVSVGEEFPSNVYAWKILLDKGVELRLVEAPKEWNEDETRAEAWNAKIIEAIDDNTIMLVMSPIHWTDGTFFDMPILADTARSVGALVVIDATQTLGAMPFDVELVKPDALIAASYKSMMGMYSMGFAYWGERFANGAPLEETWMARRGSQDMRNLVHYQSEYQEGMMRYNVGEMSNFALIPAANAALTQLLQWQPENVQAYCAHLTMPLVTALANSSFTIEEAHWRAEHLFGIAIPSGCTVERLQAELQRNKVFVSLRGAYIRVSPNVYNTTENIETLAHVLQMLE
jgi:selenocysteine lyase/cysteine desulfurase